jgi:hypothetical protein
MIRFYGTFFVSQTQLCFAKPSWVFLSNART